MKLSIGIVGSGNLATHLAKRLTSCGYTISFIHGRNATSGQLLAKRLKCPFYNALPPAESRNTLLFVCTSDTVISSIFLRAEKLGYAIIHCSGMLPLLKSRIARTGVFYPVQTFVAGKNVNWTDVPVCIESKDKDLQKSLTQLGKKIAGSTIILSSKKRAHLHLAAVFANNFVNANYTMAMRLLKTQGLSFDMLKGLILQTAMNTIGHDPSEVQTGPAKRRDLETIKAHQLLLKGKPHERLVYDSITEYLLKNK